MTAPTDAVAGTAEQGHSRLFGRNLIYVAVGSLQLVVATVVSPVTAHVLPTKEFGALASAIALVQVLAIFAVLGLDQAIVVQIGEDRNGRAARRILTAGLVVAVAVPGVVTLLAPLWAPPLGFGAHMGLVYAVALWTVPAGFVYLTLALLLAEDRLLPFSIVSALAALGGPVAGVLLVVFVRDDATTYVLACAGVQWLAAIIGVIASRPAVRTAWDRALLVRAFQLGLPLSIGYLANFVLAAGDRLVIQSVAGLDAVARYQIAYTVGSIPILLLGFTNQAWLPRIVGIRDEAERVRVAAVSRDGLYLVVTPVFLGITLGAPIALQIVGTAAFHPETLLGVVFMVALAAFPVVAYGTSQRLLVAERRTKAVVSITILAAVVNIALNLVLVPLIGILGSAAATFVAFGVLAVVQLVALPRSSRLPVPAPSVIAAVVAVVAVAALSLLLPWSEMWNGVRFAVACCCVPWFVLALRSAQRRLNGPSATPLETA